MDSITEQITQLASASPSSRRNISKALRDLSYSLETPNDTLMRIHSYHLRISAIRTGVDLKLFQLLSASSEAQDIETIAKKVGTDALLIARYLRFFASFGVINEVAVDKFSANNTTKTLADPGKEASIIHIFDTVGPAYQAAPAFLRSTNFTNPSTVTNCPFQMAYKTTKSAFEFFPCLSAESLDAFNKFMSMRSMGVSTGLSVYPFAEKTADCGPEDVIFVDVGGGIGHQCKALRDKYPDVKGRIVVQDLEQPIRGKVVDPIVEGMVHSFFDEQPIKGARFYYLRAVLHDWPDNLCHAILSNPKDAMGQLSRILIEEWVLPESGVDWTATHLDLTMMVNFAAKERTQRQWETLLDGVGLDIEGQQEYEEGWGGYGSIITVAKKQ